MASLSRHLYSPSPPMQHSDRIESRIPLCRRPDARGKQLNANRIDINAHFRRGAPVKGSIRPSITFTAAAEALYKDTRTKKAPTDTQIDATQLRKQRATEQLAEQAAAIVHS